MEKEKDGLRAKIKAMLLDRGVRKGTAGPYAVSLDLRSREGVDWDQVPPDVADRARTVKKYEVLTIRKPKDGRKP